ncbi:MAG: DUF1640 domain-containing protein [Gammaproteobacteria bacterium]|nr:DUF1640 domain-containing protein [Gammaproteobacteria bacterium]MYF66482.1 DUF1640 domain-containing protein [Gammaproteobacteria bacterium]MYK37200.1 DUF1640 domain-containing protein [Gammaproteobacteria bacterium]
MPQVLFDTHAAARKLEKAGHTAQQAEAVVEVMSEATEFGARMQHDLERIKYVVENHMATKDDLADHRAATQNDIAELRMATKEDIAELRAATKEDIAELRMSTKEDIAELRTEIRTEFAKIPQIVREGVRQETPVIQLRSAMAAGSLTFSLGGFAVMVFTNERLAAMALEHGSLIGLMMIMAGSAVMMFLALAGRSG